MASRQPLNDYLRMQLATDSELRRVLELAARRSAAATRELELKKGSGFGDRVRAAQFRAVVADLAKIQTETWVEGVGPVIRRSYPKAQKAADRAFRSIEAELGDSRAAQQLISQARKTVATGLELDRTRRARQLSPRVYRNRDLATGRVQRTIRAGIIRGLSAEELAKEVSKFISPRTPGGVSYAAMRLARTELNNAFHSASIQKAQSTPWVKGCKWNKSGSHPRRDICDELADANRDGLGKGIYRVDDVPDKPHPNCFCYITYETVSETEMLSILAGKQGRRVA